MPWGATAPCLKPYRRWRSGSTHAEIDRIVSRLSAAFEQGLPLSQSLAAQAHALRERQRVHILEEGGKATVRMLLPVAVLILPALFVVVLVPAAVELTRLGG